MLSFHVGVENIYNSVMTIVKFLSGAVEIPNSGVNMAKYFSLFPPKLAGIVLENLGRIFGGTEHYQRFILNS